MNCIRVIDIPSDINFTIEMNEVSCWTNVKMSVLLILLMDVVYVICFTLLTKIYFLNPTSKIPQEDDNIIPPVKLFLFVTRAPLIRCPTYI